MNEIFEKIYNDNNTDLNESSALFEKVYTEAEMLNEMNPKLRALLAAGLIGTASLGAASCSIPTDDPTIYEQPAPETTETTDPDDPGDNNGGISKFDSLCAELFDSAHLDEGKETIRKLKTQLFDTDKIAETESNVDIRRIFIYSSSIKGFEENTDYVAGSEFGIDGFMYITDDFIGYIVPTNMQSQFDSAISHAE